MRSVRRKHVRKKRVAKSKTAAQALLTADQKTKVAALAEAAKLIPDVNQAAALGLIEGPAHGSFERMPGPGGPPVAAMGMRHP